MEDECVIGCALLSLNFGLRDRISDMHGNVIAVKVLEGVFILRS